ncbi:hypothetical protein BT69DRAFT_1084707 [Atractiella rhizophila]|nr:hypothetical protein BT69DRAFT_1084707 [Atractiella rhizophila]
MVQGTLPRNHIKMLLNVIRRRGEIPVRHVTTVFPLFLTSFKDGEPIAEFAKLNLRETSKNTAKGSDIVPERPPSPRASSLWPSAEGVHVKLGLAHLFCVDPY